MGVILYALLCGELPFDDEDETKIKERITKRDFTLPDYLSSGIPFLNVLDVRCQEPHNGHAGKAGPTAFP
jgi:hypothetical protein